MEPSAAADSDTRLTPWNRLEWIESEKSLGIEERRHDKFKLVIECANYPACYVLVYSERSRTEETQTWGNNYKFFKRLFEKLKDENCTFVLFEMDDSSFEASIKFYRMKILMSINLRKDIINQYSMHEENVAEDIYITREVNSLKPPNDFKSGSFVEAESQDNSIESYTNKDISIPSLETTIELSMEQSNQPPIEQNSLDKLADGALPKDQLISSEEATLPIGENSLPGGKELENSENSREETENELLLFFGSSFEKVEEQSVEETEDSLESNEEPEEESIDQSFNNEGSMKKSPGEVHKVDSLDSEESSKSTTDEYLEPDSLTEEMLPEVPITDDSLEHDSEPDLQISNRLEYFVNLGAIDHGIKENISEFKFGTSFVLVVYKGTEKQDQHFSDQLLCLNDFSKLLEEKLTEKKSPECLSYSILKTENTIETEGKSISIRRYLKDKLINKDLKLAELCLMRCMGQMEDVNWKPMKVFPVEIPCPCSDNILHAWECVKCHSQVVYDFNNFVYCACGRSSSKSCSFRCNQVTHGEEYLLFPNPLTLQRHLDSLKPDKELNILLLGETGVGKSTFINAMASYLAYESLAKAETSKIHALIPSSFLVTDKNLQEQTVHIGKDINEVHSNGRSATQSCRSHEFSYGRNLVRLMDTPGVGDTRGSKQDDKNFSNILNFISHFDEIHGICILLKPNDSRLNLMFRYCIKELLCHLHRNASRNIVFLFTNSRGTFYRPGDTITPLKTLLREIEDNEPHVKIPLEKDTVYCFDSEAFRFLVALQYGINFTEREKTNYTESWINSVEELNRLLTYLTKLDPHMVKETISVNEARQMIIKLAKPLGDITQHIHINLCSLEEHKKKILDAGNNIDELRKLLVKDIKVDLDVEQLDDPCTVCGSEGCYETEMFDGELNTIYKQICHRNCFLSSVNPGIVNNQDIKRCSKMDRSTGNCKVCGCNWTKHMHVYYKLTVRKEPQIDTSIQEEIDNKEKFLGEVKRFVEELGATITEYEEEKEIITRASAKFTHFLFCNAITPVNDAINDYLDHLIGTELAKCTHDPNRSKVVVDELRASQRSYIEEKNLLDKMANDRSQGGSEKPKSNIGPEDIKATLNKLVKLKHNGPAIRKMQEAMENSQQEEFQQLNISQDRG